MSTPKIVKRYANRKLYDTERSCYVTLEDIAVMIRSGDEVKVIDNRTGEDLTTVTLAQIIFESEKKRNFMPLPLLRKLIQERSEALGEIARGQVEMVSAKAHELKESAQKLRGALGERLESTQQVADELQRMVEEKVKVGISGAMQRHPAVQHEMQELRKKLQDLTQRVDKFLS
jgi:polyhydroxyalkanoate synthesis repressor PhaR